MTKKSIGHTQMTKPKAKATTAMRARSKSNKTKQANFKLFSLITIVLLLVIGVFALLGNPLSVLGAPTMKAKIIGLGERGPYGDMPEEVLLPPASFKPAISNISVTVRWKDLQPTSSFELKRSVIDNALKEVLAYDPTRSTKVRLRIFAGAQSPEWLKNDVGRLVMKDSKFSKGDDVPKWWNPEMAIYYKNLQTKLAAAYDNPSAPEASPYADLIGEVVVSMTTDFYPEPLLRHISNGSESGKFNQNSLRLAGYTKTADEYAVKKSIDAHDVWKYTRTNFAFNPYQFLLFNSDRSEVVYVEESSLPMTKGFMDYFRSKLGQRAVFGNDSIRPDFITGDENYSPMYDYMVNHPTSGYVSFQTEVGAPEKLTYDELKSVLRWAIAKNKTPTRNKILSIEIPERVFYTNFPYKLSELTSLNKQLKDSTR